MPEPPRKMLSTPDIADYLDVHEQTVRNWIYKGWLPAYRAGRQYKVDPADLATFISRDHIDTATGGVA